VRIARGAYVARTEWEALDERARARLRLVAHHRTRATPPLFSHWSAAVLHGLPIVGDHLESIHVAVGRASGGRSARGVIAHGTDVSGTDVVTVDGLLCTSVERTIVDISAGAPMADAAAVADHAVRTGSTRYGLLAAWQRAQPMRGHRRSLDVIGFADARAESPLESISRVAFHIEGLSAPELQVRYRDDEGVIGRVDFAWPDCRVVGEADGDSKYLDPALRGGRSADRVLLDEKVREDRLRAIGLHVVRWRWSDARDPRALARRLADAGVRTR
jgi:hypothetical protein